MPAHPKPGPKAKKPGAMRSAPKPAAVAENPEQARAEKALDAKRAKAAKPQIVTGKQEKLKSGKAALDAAVGLNTPKAKKAPSTKPAAAAGTSKSDMIMAMLQKPGGASSKEMEAATGWAPHSVRGFLGTQRAKGVNIVSKKYKGEATVYSLDTAPAPAAAPSSEVGDVV